VEVLLIRHGETTDASRVIPTKYGKEGPPLNTYGREQATRLGIELLQRGADVASEQAAVSERVRTQQTAKGAGLTHIAIDKPLNEVTTAQPEQTPGLLEWRILSREALLAARNLLKNPPPQKLWVTHGLLIIGLLTELGSVNLENFIPSYREIRAIQLR
jgi:broad specificity phosphatase PhoE